MSEEKVEITSEDVGVLNLDAPDKSVPVLAGIAARKAELELELLGLERDKQSVRDKQKAINAELDLLVARADAVKIIKANSQALTPFGISSEEAFGRLGIK